MMILPQIDLRNAVISQAANRFQRRFFIREEEAARRLSCGQDASSPELGIDPLDGNPEASCQLSDCQIACDDRPPSLPRSAFEPVFKTNALDCDRQNLVCLPWRVMPFLRQNARVSSSCRPSWASAHIRAIISRCRGKAVTALTGSVTRSSVVAPPRHTMRTSADASILALFRKILENRESEM
jgi:hypothetical protein